jgi:hypothetical protein
MTIKLRKLKNLDFKNGVIIVDNRYLFLHQENSGQQQMEYFIGNKTLSEIAINNFQSNINTNSHLSDLYDFDYCHLICQAKEVAHAKEFHKATGLDLRSIASIFLSDNSVIYPRLNATDFYAGDCHNNNQGALKQVIAVIEKFSLSSLIPELNIETSQRTVNNGDLDTKIGQSSTETFINSINNISMSFDLLEIRPFLTGNSGDIKYKYNPKAFIDKRLVIFGDSFIAFHLNIWSAFFKEIIYIRSTYIAEDVVFSLNPDVVITSNTERYLINTPKTGYKSPFFLNYLSEGVMKSSFDEYSLSFINDLFSLNKDTFVEKLFSFYIPKRYGTINTETLENINLIKSALSDYKKIYNNYPISKGFDGKNSRWGSSSSDYIKGLVPDFINHLPIYNSESSQYLYWSDGNSYKFILHGVEISLYKIKHSELVDPRRPNRAIGTWEGKNALNR